MSSRKFQRTIESFTCEHCGREVTGDGYTNHCPECLYSKHVDINPGDRANPCGGIMVPLEVLVKGSEYTIVHQCERCGAITRVRAAKGDNFETLLAVARGGR